MEWDNSQQRSASQTQWQLGASQGWQRDERDNPSQWQTSGWDIGDWQWNQWQLWHSQWHSQWQQQWQW